MKLYLRGIPVELEPEDVEDLRRQLGVDAPDGLVDAEAVAKRLGCSREFVYQHAEELGGQKIGTGPRARWRFDLRKARVAKVESSTSIASSKPRPRKRPARSSSGTPLLEIRGTSPDG